MSKALKTHLQNMIRNRKSLRRASAVLRDAAASDDPHRTVLRAYIASMAQGNELFALSRLQRDFASDGNLDEKLSRLCTRVCLAAFLSGETARMSVCVIRPGYKEGVFSLETGAHVAVTGPGEIRVSVRSRKGHPCGETAEAIADYMGNHGLCAKISSGTAYISLFSSPSEERAFSGDPESLLEALDAGVPLGDIEA